MTNIIPEEDKQHPKALLEYAVKNNIREIDFRFTDLWGTEHHKTYMTSWLKNHTGMGSDTENNNSSVGFDGSSIKGWKEIYESDMLMVPDVKTAFIDPFYASPTIVVRTTIHEPDGTPYELDPRGIALKAEQYLRSLHLADTAYFGPEPEFFIFDKVMRKAGKIHILSEEVSSDNDPLHHADLKRGYFPVISDRQQDIRSEMVRTMEDLGIIVECQHHEVACAGQAEIDPRYNTLVAMADMLMLMRSVVQGVARKHGKIATYMPKIFADDNGSGMHVHQSLWKEGKPLFAGEGKYGLSDLALAYAAGIIEHGPALYAFTNPTTNSALRLVPGFEAPTYLALSISNRSAAIRIPNYEPTNPCAKRLEVRFPDPTANPYLALSAMLLAGLDGIQKEMKYVPIVEKKDLGHDLSPEEKQSIKELPPTVLKAHDILQKDNAWLAGVIPISLVDILRAKAGEDSGIIATIKTKKEYAEMSLPERKEYLKRRLAKEFELYFWI